MYDVICLERNGISSGLKGVWPGAYQYTILTAFYLIKINKVMRDPHNQWRSMDGKEWGKKPWVPILGGRHK